MAGKNNSDTLQEVLSKSSSTKQPAARHAKPRTISSPGDVSQPQKELAQKALVEFNKGNFSHSINALNKLENIRPKDVKLLHNKAVCEYYKSGLVSTDNFRKALTDIIAQSTNGKGHGRLPEWPGSLESSVAVLNLAVLFYHQHQFVMAVDLLTPLYAALESLEESVGISVCLLLASCYLSCCRPDNALSVVCHTEATFLPQPLPASHQHSTVSSSPSHTPNPAHQIRDQASVAGAGPSVTISGVSGGPLVQPEVVKEGSAGQEALRRRLQLLKVRCLVALRILKPAAREFKAALVQAATAGHELELSQICMKSQLKFLRGQPLKALKVLNTCAAITSTSAQQPATSTVRRRWPSLEVWYYNNLAVIHLALNKPTLAMVYAEKALARYLQDRKDRGSTVSLYDSGSRINAALSYNLGLILLRLNKSVTMARKAFDFFIEALQSYPSNPRVWLHLAQCCVAVHKWYLSGMSEDGVSGSSPASVGVCTLGTGPSTKLLLSPPGLPAAARRCEAPSDAAFPEPRLEFGRLCLLNALKLLPPAAGPDTDDQEGGENAPEVFPTGPSLPMRSAEAQRVRCSVLLCAGYTFLCLRQYQQALSYCTALLTALPPPDTTPPALSSYRLLASLYASECCVLLNKMNDAVKFLDLSDLKDADTLIHTDEKSGREGPFFHPGAMPITVAEQQLVLKFNLSVVFALRQEYDKATSLLHDVWCGQQGGQPAVVLMLTIYLNLKQGNTDKVKRVVQDHLLPPQ